MTDIEKREEILAEVDRAIEPAAMTQAEALDFLEGLNASIEARIDGVRADIADDDVHVGEGP